MSLTTTLNRIRSRGPCDYGWTTLLKFLGKTKGDDEPLSFLTIMESNGLADALWALDCIPDEFKLKVHLLACTYAEKVVHYLPRWDNRPRLALEAAKKFGNGEIDYLEMYEAKESALLAFPGLRASTEYRTSVPAAWAAIVTCYLEGSAMASMSWITDLGVCSTDELKEIFINWLKEFDQ